MRKTGRQLALLTIGLAATISVVHAQQSTNFKLDEHVFNSGGSPVSGTGSSLSSTNFRVRLSSLGEGLIGPALSSASFRVDSGFTQGLLPPGETGGLIFTSQDTLEWSAHLSAGTYNLYRGLHSNLTGLGFGQCEQQGLTGTGATDADPVPVGDAFFYLVTVENRLGEEGTKGSRSDGTDRLGNICP
jgi:hypothetical protein